VINGVARFLDHVRSEHLRTVPSSTTTPAPAAGDQADRP
jgi:hypothetical protein